VTSDICRCLGTEVFVGINKKDGREAAVKRVQKMYKNMVKRELDHLLKLEHDNIVRYQVQCYDDGIF